MVMVVGLTVIGLYVVLLLAWLVRESGEASREPWMLSFSEEPATRPAAATGAGSSANERPEAVEQSTAGDARRHGDQRDGGTRGGATRRDESTTA